MRSFDKIVLVWWVPTIQGPVYLSFLKALGKKRPEVVVVCHNVMQHEAKKTDVMLARAVLGQADRVIVHTKEQAALASQVLSHEPVITKLPRSLIVSAPQKTAIHRKLVFFGLVRPYKGVDVLIRAVATVPDVQLSIAGECWGGTAMYDALIQELGVQDRVTIESRYLEVDELIQHIAGADAVVLPYKSGTASWNVELSHACGTPVIATTTGSFGKQVRDGVDGLLCKPDDVESLAAAIKHFYEPGVAKHLQAGVPASTTEEDWQAYVDAVVSPIVSTK
jgi:glycosyltransferase involved in cell wall biosynthesis